MRFDVLALFPEIISGYMSQSLLKLAIQRDLVQIHLHNMRDWSVGKHNQVDDRPFGGGPGMVLRPDVVVEAVEAVQAQGPAPGHLVALTPSGRKLNQQIVEELATHPRIVFVCGRYEGFDQRALDLLQPDEISIGDYVLGGGEVASIVTIDAVVRLVPGVIGDEESSKQDSFSGEHRMLEYPQFTRPRVYRDLQVPEILLNGDHQKIADWRFQQSLERTRQRRADLLPDEKQ